MAAYKIPVGISSCLLGERVRFDAGHKKNGYITGVLADYFEFVPFCPEMAVGLGAPRETLRLVACDNEIRAVGNKTPTLDVSQALTDAAARRRTIHAGLCGYILKKDSPSCGMERVKVYKDEGDIPERNGSGLFAARLMQDFPYLPIEEEGRLEDARLRENFIQRVFVLARWQALNVEPLTIAKLQNFHARHKRIFMNHEQNAARELGAMLADALDELPSLATTYRDAMMTLLKHPASCENHVNILQHTARLSEKAAGC